VDVAHQSGDSRVLDVFRRFAQLRERLVPYLHEQAEAGIAVGLPLMRPLGLVHPHDDRGWRQPTQYMLGDELLVCPVTEFDTNEWSCYLPDGDWVDVWTGARRTGPATVAVDAPLDQVPVWCRAQAWPALSDIFPDVRVAAAHRFKASQSSDDPGV
jgi:alpha-glucosidase (family GH31 glycosyl hydrolase)